MTLDPPATSIADALADFTTRLYEAPDTLPPDVRAAASERLLDNFACLLFGPEIAPAATIADLACRMGNGRCRVAGRSQPTSPPAAALANGTFIQAFELNDLGVYVHPGASIVAACLAALDETPAAVTGAQFLAALVAGYEITIRLSECVGPSAELEIGWHTPGFHGAVGAAASAGVLLGLDRSGIAQAIAIAADIAGGGLMFARLGSDVKRMHAGRAAETGVFAALLAREGLACRTDVIEHPRWGYCRTMTASTDRYDLSEITGDLGRRFVAFFRTAVKYYPVGAEIQGVIDNIMRLKAEHEFAVDQISDVTVGTTTFFVQAAVHRVPEALYEIHFNVEYGATMALLHDLRPVHEGADILRLWIEGYGKPGVRSLTRRVRHVADPELDGGNPYSVDSRVTIALRDGRTLTTASSYVSAADSQGTMRFAPMAGDRIRSKFENMTRNAALPDNKGDFARKVLDIFEVPDAKSLWSSVTLP